MGRSLACGAISRSVGTVTATPTPSYPLSLLSQSRKHLPAPGFRGLDLIEGEDVYAGHLQVRPRQLRHEPRRKAIGSVTARLDHAQQPVRVAAQEPGGVAETDPGRDPQQLGRAGDARHAYVDGQLQARLSHARHPPLAPAHVEAEVATDAGCQCTPGP